MIRSPVGGCSTLVAVLALGLALAPGPTAALGLGQIQVKSKPGQPLVAEIPIISSDPAELQGLKVQLASPETFRRVGLEPPQGLVSTLRFQPALDASGRPVVRVTSQAPVQQPLLTFLLEVDWGQGRLVREYSALVDVPRSVSAPLQSPIQAPVVAPSNVIARPAPVVAAPPQPTPPATNPPDPAPLAAAPAPENAAAPVVALARRPDIFGPVRAGQTLGEIVAGLADTQGYSTAQTMLALVRANPQAFIGGNVNLLKRGAVLRLPPAAELGQVDRRQAAALVHEQILQWRNARRPPPQAGATPAPAATGRQAAALDNTPGAARTADARLQIVPASAARGSKTNQAMRSGTEAGGEGDMLRQQLQDTKETLAARNAEVNELKSRVLELEKLQQQQQQLLTLKDSALAAAQQSLAKANASPATPALATASTRAAPAVAPQPPAHGASIWLWGGLVLVLSALAGWLFSTRRPRAAAPGRRFDVEALAAGMTVAPKPRGPAGDNRRKAAAADSPAAEATAPAAVVAPPWHAAASEEAAGGDAAPSGAGEQLRQAQACLARGDEDAARALLREVLDGRDPAAREQAAKLLRDL